MFSDNTGTSIGSSITLNSSGYPEAGGNVITLFRDSSIAIKLILFPNATAAASLTNAVWTADTLEDGLVILASTSNGKGASLVGIEDAGSIIIATTVEGALAEIVAGFAKLTRANTFTATQTWSSGAQIQMNDNFIRRATLVDYGIEHNNVQSAAGILTLDLTTGNSFRTTLTENTTVVLSNPSAAGVAAELRLRVVQDGAGGAFTLTFPASVKWPSGSAPVITVTNNAIDKIVLDTDDEGVTWLGDFSLAYA